jgi:8-oxo-dGTP pyrophosphatase MutT (NUDIX family)
MYSIRLGHLENDEFPIQAAERETEEEAGLNKNDLEYYDKFEEKTTYNVNGQPKDVYYYLARLRDAQKKINLSEEHQNLSWSNLQDACNLVKYENMQNILRKAEEFIKNF